MFENAGSKLKSLSPILFSVSVISIIIVAICMLVILPGSAITKILILTMAAVFIVFAYLAFAIIATIGDIAESTSYLRTANFSSSRTQHINTQYFNSTSGINNKEPVSDDSALKKMLDKSLSFTTDSGCRDYIKNNIHSLDNNAKTKLLPLNSYISSNDPSGIKEAVQAIILKL